MSTLEGIRWDFEQDERRNDHEAQDHDPLEWAGCCEYCELTLEKEITDGVRCNHGQYIPFINGIGEYMTDIECPQCQIDYGTANETKWIHELGRVMA